MSYRLIEHKTTVERTHWWKDQNAKICETSYWIEGPGVNRPATDIEVMVFKDAVARSMRAVKAFENFVNVTEIGGTPEGALRKEFGIE